MSSFYLLSLVWYGMFDQCEAQTPNSLSAKKTAPFPWKGIMQVLLLKEKGQGIQRIEVSQQAIGPISYEPMGPCFEHEPRCCFFFTTCKKRS